MGTAFGAFTTPGLNNGGSYGLRTFVQNNVCDNDSLPDGIQFDLSRTNAIWSNSAQTVQPAASLCMVAIRF